MPRRLSTNRLFFHSTQNANGRQADIHDMMRKKQANVTTGGFVL